MAIALIAVILGAMLSLVLAAPKNLPPRTSACPDPPPPFTGAIISPSPVCDSLSSAIIESPVPSVDQRPVLPAGVLVIGFVAGAAVVVTARAQFRRRLAA